MMMIFVFMSKAPKKCGWSDNSQLLCAFSDLLIESLHKKLVLKGNKSLWFLLKDCIIIQFPQDQIIANVGVGMNRMSVSLSELPKEILEWEKGFIKKLIGTNTH